MDWDQIVKHLTVSSNESQAYRLIDSSHSTFWQSSGPQGKVYIYSKTFEGESFCDSVVKLESSREYFQGLSTNLWRKKLAVGIENFLPLKFSTLQYICTYVRRRFHSSVLSMLIDKHTLTLYTYVCPLTLLFASLVCAALDSTGNAEKHTD